MTAPRPAASGHLDARPRATPPGPPLPAGVTRLELGPGAEAYLAVPPAGPTARALWVFCHGAGGNAHDALRAVGREAVGRGVVVLATTSAGSTWDLVAGGLGRDVAVLDAALEQVFDRLPVDRVALGGFSDGGSYALSLGVANGDLFGDVLAFSPGFLAPPAQEGLPRIWICHGTDDRVLPVDRCGRRVAGQLRQAGYDVGYDEFAGGHVITPELVRAGLDRWLPG